jgi:hypothetical protein
MRAGWYAVRVARSPRARDMARVGGGALVRLLEAITERPELRLNLHGRKIGDLVVLGTVPNVPWPSGRSQMGRTAWLCQSACGRRIVVPTMHLTRKRNPFRNCGCRHLKPSVIAKPLSPDTPPLSPLAVPCDRPVTGSANGNGNGHGSLPLTTTAQQALGRVHDQQSPLGRVRRVCHSVTEGRRHERRAARWRSVRVREDRDDAVRSNGGAVVHHVARRSVGGAHRSRGSPHIATRSAVTIGSATPAGTTPVRTRERLARMAQNRLSAKGRRCLSPSALHHREERTWAIYFFQKPRRHTHLMTLLHCPARHRRRSTPCTAGIIECAGGRHSQGHRIEQGRTVRAG